LFRACVASVNKSGNYLELIQYENPNSTLKQSKDTNLYSCSYKNLCEKFIWSTIRLSDTSGFTQCSFKHREFSRNVHFLFNIHLKERFISEKQVEKGLICSGLARTLCKTGSVRQFVCTIIPSNYLELIQYENPNSTLKQSKDTNLYSCSYKNLCEKFIQGLHCISK
jgi:hypothetical protein